MIGRFTYLFNCSRGLDYPFTHYQNFIPCLHSFLMIMRHIEHRKSRLFLQVIDMCQDVIEAHRVIPCDSGRRWIAQRRSTTGRSAAS